MSKQKTILLCIDMQEDFANPKGSLYVPGGEKCSQNLGKMLDRMGDAFDDIIQTLDQHYLYSIFHSVFWTNTSGTSPNPFTQITSSDVKTGKWRPSCPTIEMRDYVIGYLTALEAKGKSHTIWPDHCLISGWGSNAAEAFYKSKLNWERKNLAYAFAVSKGSQILCEHYGALQAEIPLSSDPTTQLNSSIIDMLADPLVYDIAVGGLALDYCLSTTLRQVHENFGDDFVKKFVLLEDATASINPKAGEDFINEFVAKGMRLSTTDKYLA